MPDKAFIDTNILIYFISNDNTRKAKAREVIFNSSDAVISSQVISEFISICIQKHLLTIDEVVEASQAFMRALRFVPIQESTITTALKLTKKYKYSYWDSLITAAALENDCSVLYSEDLQHGQLINNRLRITNPFHI